MRYQQQVVGAALGLHHDVLCLVFRSPIGIHNDGTLRGKVLGETDRYRTHYVSDGACVVIARDADHNVSIPNLFQAILEFSWEKFVHGVCQ